MRFNCRRGLAVEHFIDRRLSTSPLFGTLHHGRFDDIAWGADYYSGHLVFQTPGSHQITDLQAVEPTVHSQGSCLVIAASIPTPLGPIQKTWTLDAASHNLQLRIQLHWPEAGLGRLRLVPFTVFPKAFNADTLQVSAANGGTQQECFPLDQQPLDHGKAVSFLVSAHQGLGLTDGVVQVGDSLHAIQLGFNPADAALLGQIQHQPVDGTWFTRLSLSARELDDTAKHKEMLVSTTIKYECANLM